MAGCLELTTFQNVRYHIDVLAAVKDGFELLFAGTTHDALGACARVEDVERVDDVCKRDGLVTLDPFLVLFGVDDDHEFVGGLRVGLVDDFVEGLHGWTMR